MHACVDVSMNSMFQCDEYEVCGVRVSTGEWKGVDE